MAGAASPDGASQDDPSRPADRSADGLETWRELAVVESGVTRATLTARLTAYVLAAAVLVPAVLLAARAPLPGGSPAAVFTALVALYVVAYRVEFHAVGGSMVPTQPVLVAMLATQLELAPLGVVVGVLLGSVGAERQGAPAYDWAVRVIPAGHSLAPAAVLSAAGLPLSGWEVWPWLAAAMAAQFALDAALAAARMASVGVGPRVLLRPLAWTFRVDALMTLVGLGLVLGSAGAPPAVLAFVGAVILVVRMLGRDRQEQVEQSRSLGAAFEDVSHQATSDPMTGLGNRRCWEEAVAAAGRRRELDPSTRVAVVAGDLDGLKHANDTRGHGVGDDLLVAFAALFARTAPPGAVVARLGGDEFAMLVTSAGPGDPVDGDALVAAVRDAMAGHPPVAGLRVSASLGWGACPPLTSPADAAAAADREAVADKRRRRAGRAADPPGGGSPRV